MARGKKKESALTLEEKLAQALVPDWECPHRIPKNWLWIQLDAVLNEIKNGTTIKQDKSGEGYSVTRIESLQNQTIDFGRLGTIVDSASIKDADWYRSGDVALSHINSAEHVGKTALITQDMLPLVHGMNLLRLRFNEACLPVFFQYYSRSFQYKSEILERINMAVNQVSINQKQLGSLEFPLPPLAEQQRIVDRIESLFAKLDEAKEKAQAVLDSFETRKAAILHKAFTGELTAKWRAEHGVGMDSWQSETLQSVCSMKITDGTHKTPTYCNADIGVPFISAKDVTGEAICWDKIKYIVPELHEELYARLAPQLDDILLAKNGTTGVAAIVDVDKVFDLYVTLAVLRPDKSKILPRYLLRIVNSPVCKNQFDEHLTGIGVPNLHLRDIKEVVIQVPSLAEQMAIIQVVDSIMDKEQRAREAAEAVLEKIDLLKKSILARAFRGELGTNDPSEESAIELLKRILESDVPAETKKRSKSIPKKLREKLETELERKIIHLYFQRETESVPAEVLLSVSSKKFDVLEALHNLEHRGLIKRLNNGNYRLLG